MTSSQAAEIWQGEVVLVTGGAGFLSWSVVDGLRARGVPENQSFVPRRAMYDLRHWEAIQQALSEAQARLPGALQGLSILRSWPGREFASAADDSGRASARSRAPSLPPSFEWIRPCPTQ